MLVLLFRLDIITKALNRYRHSVAKQQKMVKMNA
jgi:hypothetical protein